MRTNRRQFIKISALGLGGVATATAAGGGSFLSIMDSPEEGPSVEFKRYATYCEVCFWKCAAWTQVNKEGEIVKIIGNVNDPHC